MKRASDPGALQIPGNGILHDFQNCPLVRNQKVVSGWKAGHHNVRSRAFKTPWVLGWRSASLLSGPGTLLVALTNAKRFLNTPRFFSIFILSFSWFYGCLTLCRGICLTRTRRKVLSGADGGSPRSKGEGSEKRKVFVNGHSSGSSVSKGCLPTKRSRGYLPRVTHLRWSPLRFILQLSFFLYIFHPVFCIRYRA